jgi:hypothetical protein
MLASSMKAAPHTTESGSPRARLDRALGQFAAAEPIAVRVRGACMPGTVDDGEVVSVRASRWYLPGDVVVVRGAGGDLLAHRVLGFVPTWGPRRGDGVSRVDVVTQADTASYPDRRVSLSAVLGRVLGAEPSAADRGRALLGFARYGAGAFVRRVAGAAQS